MIFSIIQNNMVSGYSLYYGDESYRNVNRREDAINPRVWLLPYTNNPVYNDFGNSQSVYSIQLYVEKMHPDGIDIWTPQLLGEREQMEADALQLIANIEADASVQNVNSISIAPIPANDTDHAFNGVLVSLTVEMFQGVICSDIEPAPSTDQFPYVLPFNLA
jgi:hypothetical protein